MGAAIRRSAGDGCVQQRSHSTPPARSWARDRTLVRVRARWALPGDGRARSAGRRYPRVLPRPPLTSEAEHESRGTSSLEHLYSSEDSSANLKRTAAGIGIDTSTAP